MNKAQNYYLHGLGLHSDIQLDEPTAPDQTPDLSARLGPDREVPSQNPAGELVAELVFRGKRWYTVTETRDALLVRFPGLADFVLANDFSTIDCHPDPDTDPRALSVLLTGTVISVYLGLRGSCVLHASAVELGGRAVVFTGLSNMGKSTCAALACATGALLVTDDVLVADPTGQPHCLRGASHLRVRQQASSIVEAFEVSPKTWETVDGRLAIAPPRSRDQLPIAAIVIPRPSRESTRLVLERRRSSLAVRDLLSFLRIPGWKRHDIVSRQFRQVATLADRVPVYEALIPWGPPFSVEPIRELLDRVVS